MRRTILGGLLKEAQEPSGGNGDISVVGLPCHNLLPDLVRGGLGDDLDKKTGTFYFSDTSVLPASN